MAVSTANAALRAPAAAGSGSTQADAGTTKDPALGRNFPCDGCGAKLEFHIGQQSLKCPFCGNSKALEIPEGAAVKEQDLGGALRKQAEQRISGAGAVTTAEIKCAGCGGTTQFTGTLTSTECPYCGSPIQRENVHDSPSRVPADGVLPFLVTREQAADALRKWVGSRWFAPSEFRRRGVNGVFSGIYLPYWTYDAMTATRWSGQRGIATYVTVGEGKNQRREKRVDWHPVAGSFQRFFDDVMVCACTGVPDKLLLGLEPWPVDRVIPFTPHALSGYLARTYDVEIDKGLADAKQRMASAIAEQVKSAIGGDEQRVTSVDTMHFAITFKHLLLPVWLLTYRFGNKPYQLAVNAATGEVQGERPYSWIKILLFVTILLAVIVGGLVALSATNQG